MGDPQRLTNGETMTREKISRLDIGSQAKVEVIHQHMQADMTICHCGVQYVAGY
jgi:hypothetical protein